ncbi:hypothetical protein TNCV_1509221 [Trichonephila clavipes]|nr:hypothetical protein TNCV_1509221 [Trichonephila clavipes]
MFHSCSIGERSGDLVGKGNMLILYRVCQVTTGYESTRYPVGKYPLNDVYKWQGNSLNHLTEVSPDLLAMLTVVVSMSNRYGGKLVSVSQQNRLKIVSKHL